ncbi:MAG: efflux RND transporter permease subunit [Myxococcales bacterium]|nr:efflux RND transporter permease subunit [Myxococcales bacterium]
MTLTRASLDNNRITVTLLAILLYAGVSAYFSLPQQMDPGFTVRTAQIVTRFPGASPERVEQLVANPIEQAVQTMPELDFVASTSRNGVSIVTAAFREEFKNIRPIFDDLRRKISAVDLPAGVATPEVNDELGDIYPMVFTVSTDGFSDAQVKQIAKDVRDQLLLIDGIGKVVLLGEQDDRIFVEFSDARLSSLGLTPVGIQQSLSARNIILPGGEVEIGPETLSLEPSGNFDSLSDIKRTILRLPNGRLTYLEDIARVRRGYVDPPEGIVTTNGYRSIALFINMSDGYSLVELGARVQKFFDGLLRHYPHGVDFELSYFQPKEVEEKVSDFISNVLQAVAIVLITMLVTLGLRTGLIVSSLIPAAMIITILIIGFLGESINQMSLAALIIALGLLVDNAIVVSESIMVSMAAGQSAYKAAIDSCRELQIPLFVSSLTTASAFLPIYLAEAAVGEYTGSLFVVVSATLLVSWFLALTMIPLLCVFFMKISKQQTEESYSGWFYRVYRGTLVFVLRQRIFAILVLLAAFFGTLPLWGLVPSIFFPEEERAFFMAKFELPPGSSMQATLDMSERIDRFIQDELTQNSENVEGVTSWTSFIGETPQPFRLGYSPSPSQGGYCELMINVSSIAYTYKAMKRLRAFTYDALPDAKAHIRMLSSGPAVDKPVQIRVFGQDMGQIYSAVDRIKSQLRTIPGVINIGDNWGSRTKKLGVTIDSERALRAGASHEDVATSLNTVANGMTTTHFREGDESIPVVLRSVDEERRNIDRLKTISVYTQSGPRPLSQVADLELQIEPAAILRRDRSRTVTIEAQVAEGRTALEVFDQIQPWLSETQQTWPLGLRWEFGGEFESSRKANNSIGVKLPIAGMVILLLLVWQFNSLRKTAIVLSSIVLAMIGVVLGLVLFKASFGFMTLLGVVSLAGIVINNAIVLLDRIRIEIDSNGLLPEKAVVHAAQQRLRPILLTTATTIASLIPLYLTGGLMWQPMAVAIISGLLFSTILTLLVVPLLYSMFFRVDRPA